MQEPPEDPWADDPQHDEEGPRSNRGPSGAERSEHEDQVNVDPAARSSWTPVDLTDVLSGTWLPPQPTVGLRDDGKGLFYPGRAHSIAGEPEGGKTWLALSACLDEMHAGRNACYVDFEDTEGSVVGRLLTLGTTRETIRKHFHYIRPEGEINVREFEETLHDLQPTLTVLDGVTEGLALHGLDPLSNLDWARFSRKVIRRITESGSAAVALDHLTKSSEGRGRWAIGAQHKLAGLDGAAYILENRAPFGVGLTGRSTIRIAKDRPGQLRCNALPGTLMWYGDLVVASKGQEFAEVSVEPPHEQDENWQPTELMQKMSAEAAKSLGPFSQNTILQLVKGNTDRKRTAWARLVQGGYIVGTSGKHTLAKPYEGDES